MVGWYWPYEYPNHHIFQKDGDSARPDCLWWSRTIVKCQRQEFWTTLPSPPATVPKPLALSDKDFQGKPLAPWTTPRTPKLIVVVSGWLCFLSTAGFHHLILSVGNSLHIYWQVGNSAYVGCFVFWAPNTIVDSITYGGMILTVRIPEPSYFSERWMQRPARHKMPATRVLDHPPSPTVPTPLAPSDKSFLGKPLAPWTTPRTPLADAVSGWLCLLSTAGFHHLILSLQRASILKGREVGKK